MRKVMVITGRRAEFGLIKSTLKAIREHESLELCLVVTGNHLIPEFGGTIKQIKEEGFEINAKVNAYPKEDSGVSMAKAIGECILGLVDVVEKEKPDVMLVLTDLGHALAGSIVGAHMNIPLAHVHGGDVSGTIDESLRHAITKFAHIHFPATEKSAERIRKMGEEEWRIHVTGAPGLDEILHQELYSKHEVCGKFGLDPGKPMLLMVQHPVTTEVEQAESQIKETMSAVADTGYQTVVIYPNADAGARQMIKVIERYANEQGIQIHKNLDRKTYLSLMKHADAMVGNTSSGIIEAPSFRTPVVNIGTRQNGRERAGNVIDVGHDRAEILEGIEKAMSKEFRTKMAGIKSPYGDGKTGSKIADILTDIDINKRLMQKKLSY
ncbi:UDP-N-acetylglucosamine 2-epimerase [Candidatus Altiarchaeota archaeon]